MTPNAFTGLWNRRRLLGTGLAGVLSLGLGSVACQDGGAPEDPSDRALRIAVVPKGTNMTFWRTIHAGAIKAQRDLAERGVAVEILWKGPLREDDREQQIQVVEGFTSQKVDGILLAPLDSKALVRPVEEARRLGIPTVIFDSGLDSEDIVSFVATDNFKGGELAADEMGRLLEGRGKVLLLRYQEGSASTTAREEGFLTQLGKAWPDITVVSSDQHAGPTRDTGKRAAENLLNRFGTELDGVFVVNETSTRGMLLALQDTGLAGKVRFLGFDGTPAYADAVRAGEMDGFVIQDPFGMAALAVETMVDHLHARPVPPPGGHRGPCGERGEPRHGRGPAAAAPAPRPVPDRPGMTPALRLSGIVKRFGATLALDGADLEVQPGEVLALLGENGAGKSTLLSILGGLLLPDGGSLEVEGAPYAARSPRDARERGIALIHQELSLFPHLSVAENVLVGGEPRRHGLLDREEARRRTRAVLAEFGHPEIDPDTRVSRLPIAARQVVEICRAIAGQARVVLMDEPTSSLQRADVERLFALIRRLAGSGVAIVYISHFLEEAREVARAFSVLRDGRSVAGGSLGAVTNDELIAHMVGRTVDTRFPARDHAPSEAVELEVRGLAAPPAVRDASFTLRRGEVLGVFGLMGSGRTEMVRSLFGLDPSATGTMTRGGSEGPVRGTPARRLAQGLGYLSEDRKGEGLALPMSVADNVTVTRFSSCSRLGVLDPRRQSRQARERARELKVKMRSPDQPVRTLSGGNQQKVAMARLLHQEADVLLLDEPTRGIDVASKAQIYEAIEDAASRGKAVLMVSSYLPELLGVCDRLAVMSRGRLGVARPVDEWTPEQVMEAAIGA